MEFDDEALIKTSLSYKKIEFLGFNRIWQIIENTSLIEFLALDDLKLANLGKE